MMAPQTIERDISPPPRKKVRRSQSPERSVESNSSNCDQLLIYSWNVNGLSNCLPETIQPRLDNYFKQTSTPTTMSEIASSSLHDFLRRHDWPALLFLQEVKINPDDTATIRAVEKAVKRQSHESSDAHDYEAHMCLPSGKFNARGFGRKVYGVCSIVRKDFKEQYVEKIRPVSWDREGRFLVIETKAADNMPKLAIINVYMVNGTDNPYKDPDTGQISGTRHDRKLAVHSLLQQECRKLEGDGFRVVIAGDINIARRRIDGHPNLRTFTKQHCVNRADFEAKFFKSQNEKTGDKRNQSSDDGLDMIDSFRHLYPEKKAYTFYPRTKDFGASCDRVDMILLSRSLEADLKDAGMHESAKERGSSDHVPLFISLRFEAKSGEVHEKHK